MLHSFVFSFADLFSWNGFPNLIFAQHSNKYPRMPRRKALKVVVDVELHAVCLRLQLSVLSYPSYICHFFQVTCPGVFLPDRQDVFIDIDIFGHRKRTQCHPPVFPFLFHEKVLYCNSRVWFI